MRTPHQISFRVRRFLLCGLAALACSDVAPTSRELEGVPFEDLDGTTIMFTRVDFSGPDPRYVVDGSTRTVGIFDELEEAVISPDGKTIAYSDLVDDWDIHAASLDGSQPRRLSNASNNVEGPPSWSADGTRVVYPSSFIPVVEAAIRSILPTGTGDRVERVFPRVDGAWICPTVEALDDRVAQSPGGEFAFVCGGGLYVASTEAAEAPRLVHDARAAGATVNVRSPAWSPDGSLLAFFEYDHDRIRLRVLDVVEGSITTLDDRANLLGIANLHTLCWSRSGGTIVFVGSAAILRAQIFTVRVDGGVARAFTTKPGMIDHTVSCAWRES